MDTEHEATERRRHGREEVHYGGTITLRGHAVPCSVRNRSQSGVLLEVPLSDAGKLSQDDIGQEIDLSIQSGEQDRFPARGRIIRLISSGPSVFIALFFL
jgi:hypothetical protein